MTSGRSTIGAGVGREVKAILLDRKRGSCLGLDLATLGGWLFVGGSSLRGMERLQAGRSRLRPLGVAILAQHHGFNQPKADELVGFSVDILVTGSTHLLSFTFQETNTMIVGLQSGKETRRQGAAKLHGAVCDENQGLVAVRPARVCFLRTVKVDEDGQDAGVEVVADEARETGIMESHVVLPILRQLFLGRLLGRLLVNLVGAVLGAVWPCWSVKQLARPCARYIERLETNRCLRQASC